MRKRTFKAVLSTSSLKQLSDDLKSYRGDMNRKTDEFFQRLADVGIKVIDERISQADGQSDTGHYTTFKVDSFGDATVGTLSVYGKDLLFIEFGSGIHYNGAVGNSPHPKGMEYGYTIGSYGNGNGANDFWYYPVGDGTYKRSYGTKATMPVYMAGNEMLDKVVKIAKEVFGG